ncbi:hypothetical protein PG993_014794 [Apiospora rasikravindrae]|uniref:Uncharacterized protein n=1 Tax=Apiospora rasikravindrae TaxID=990691 RepID=A0ABR1RNR4_9PEZI
MSDRRTRQGASTAPVNNDQASQATGSGNQASGSGSQATGSGSQPAAAAAAAAPAQGMTSAQLDYYPMRIYQRRRRAREIIERRFAASAKFMALSAAQQLRVRTEVEELIRENIVDFMDNTPPRTLYPYEAAVKYAIAQTIEWNPDICGPYVANEWPSGLEEEGNADEVESNEDGNPGGH